VLYASAIHVKSSQIVKRKHGDRKVLNIHTKSHTSPWKRHVTMRAGVWLVARGLSPRGWVDRCENLALTITTHRIVLTKQLENNDEQGGNEQQQGVQARFIQLSHLLECRPEKTSMFASPKVLLTTYSGDFFNLSWTLLQTGSG
jgi:hypothetical protein